MLGLAITSCLVASVGTTPVLGTLSVEDSTTHFHTIDVTVGTAFKADVWTRNIPKPGVVNFQFRIAWDPRLINLVSRDINDHGLGVVAEAINNGEYEIEFVSPFPHSGYTTDASWVTFTFRCLGEGSSGITITYSHGSLSSDRDFSFSLENATVNQRTSQPFVDLVHGDVTLWSWFTAAGVIVCLVVAVAIVHGRRGHYIREQSQTQYRVPNNSSKTQRAESTRESSDRRLIPALLHHAGN